MPLLSLIIAVYNRPEVLRFVLAACGRQSLTDFEIIVADDGSGPEVKDVIEKSRARDRVPITHLWHEDLGWRKNVMLNKAILAARSEYLVFVDGDCLPAKDFLMDHWNQRETGKVLLGRRVETSERWARALTMEKIDTGRFEMIGLTELVDGIAGRAARLEDAIRIRSGLLRRLSSRSADRILGSNFSLHKNDIVSINGFDEEYDGPGHGEDSDVQYRLSLIGVMGKSIRNLAIQFHVYHPRTEISQRSLKRFEDVKRTNNPRCKRGLEKID